MSVIGKSIESVNNIVGFSILDCRIFIRHLNGHLCFDRHGPELGVDRFKNSLYPGMHPLPYAGNILGTDRLFIFYDDFILYIVLSGKHGCQREKDD